MGRIEDALSFACSLDAEQLDVRRREWRSLDPALIESRDRPNGMIARYRGDDETMRALERLVESERACCPEFVWRLQREGDEIHVEVSFVDRD